MVVVVWAILVAITVMLALAIGGCLRHLTQLQAQLRITDIQLDLLREHLGIPRPEITEMTHFEQRKLEDGVS